MAVQHQGIISRFFDRLDGIEQGLPEDLLAEDFHFEMCFPGLAGSPDERISGSKEDFHQFMEGLRARGPSSAGSAERRHHIRTLEVIDGVEFMLGKAIGGRRNGTILAAAESNDQGLMTRYVVVMSAVTFGD
jgi:hypothetical protein